MSCAARRRSGGPRAYGARLTFITAGVLPPRAARRLVLWFTCSSGTSAGQHAGRRAGAVVPHPGAGPPSSDAPAPAARFPAEALVHPVRSNGKTGPVQQAGVEGDFIGTVLPALATPVVRRRCASRSDFLREN